MTREEFFTTLEAVDGALEKWMEEYRGFSARVDSDDETAFNNIMINLRYLRCKFEKRYGV